MSLINCKECGQPVSDRATSCPRCGYPLTEQTPVDDYEETPKSSRGKWLVGIITFIAVCAVGVAAWLIFGSGSATEADAAEANAASQVNKETPDLAFLGLHGPVKRCIIPIEGIDDQVYEFDEDGNISNFSEKGISKIERDKDGYIIEYYSEEETAIYRFKWENGRLIEKNVYFDDGVNMDAEGYYYDDKGLINQVVVQRIAFPFNYSDYEFDAFGNWVSRTQEGDGVLIKEERYIMYFGSDEGLDRMNQRYAAGREKADAESWERFEKQQESQRREMAEAHNTTSAYTASSNVNGGQPTSSNNTQFRSPSDVMSYLAGKTFSGGGATVRFDYNTVYVNGTAITAAPRVSNITPSTATITASSPYMGGQDIRFYLNANRGSVTLDSGESLYLR